jgi:DNA repair protein RadC
VAAQAEVIWIANCYRIEVVRTKIAELSPPLRSTKEAAHRYSDLQRYDRERLVRLDLDSKNRVISEEVVAIGTLNAALMSPREVFKGAILSGAAAIILLHNHPSGSCCPSDEDERVNGVLQRAGELLGIPLLDFVIIGQDGRYWSPGSGEGQVEVDGARPASGTAGCWVGRALAYSRSGKSGRGSSKRMDRPWPGMREMNPCFSSVSIIWCTEGGETAK